MNRDEAGAKSVDAGKILVTARLVDAALAAPFGFERLDRHAVRNAPAIAAALAHLGMDEGADRGIGPLAALPQAPPLGRARLIVKDDRDAPIFAEFALGFVHRVAMAQQNAGRERDAEVALWIVDDRSEEHTSELQSPLNIVCRLLLE